MNLTNKLDKRTLLGYYENKNFAAAKELLNNYFSRDNKNVFQIASRINIENVNAVKEQPKYSNYNTNKPFEIGYSKITMWFIIVVSTILSGAFGYQYFENGQVSTTSIVVSLIALSSALFSIYGLLDSSKKLTLNNQGAYLNYNKKQSLKWSEILAAYRYSDHGSTSDHRLLIFKYKTIEPETWTISNLNRTEDEIAYVFNKFLQNENKN
jgi:hypothetical protein